MAVGDKITCRGDGVDGVWGWGGSYWLSHLLVVTASSGMNGRVVLLAGLELLDVALPIDIINVSVVFQTVYRCVYTMSRQC